MGKIAPSFQKDKKAKRVLRDAVWAKLNEEQIDGDGSVTTYAEIMANRLVNVACFAESDKDAISAAKFLKEWMEGKSPVTDSTEKIEMPMVKFILNEPEVAMIEDKASQPYEEEEELDRVIVSIEGIDGEMEL
jgi:hypothetical protein